MKAFTEKMHNELLSKLDELDRNYDPIILTDPRLNIITDTIDQIKEKLKTHRFHIEEDEIHYFKKVLPETLALYFYYIDKMERDRIIRLDSDNCTYKFHDRIFSQAENFRTEHTIFYKYLRDGKTDMDNFYFLRTSPINKETKYPVIRILHPSTPPLHCELLAKHIAYNRLEFESKVIIAEVKETLSSLKTGQSKLKWTARQIDLIELGYALKEANAFNHGNASLNEIFRCFKNSFDFDTGSTSRIFQDIIRRKTDSPLFLDLLKQKLLERIDDFLN
jgi:hypothetical protein